MTLAEVTAAVDMLRARGVKSYVDVAGGGFEIEFWPPEAPEPKFEAAKVDAQRCACGHLKMDEHLNGLCIAPGGGCDPLLCSPEQKK